jgi:hypothetical protein
MTENRAAFTQDLQRVSVAFEGCAPGKRLKISLENFDNGLGWYAAGSLSIPLHQLPCLEQAIEELRRSEANSASTPGTIIPFPGLLSVPAALAEDPITSEQS